MVHVNYTLHVFLKIKFYMVHNKINTEFNFIYQCLHLSLVSLKL
jgi:hypothetical protein